MKYKLKERKKERNNGEPLQDLPGTPQVPKKMESWLCWGSVKNQRHFKNYLSPRKVLEGFHQWNLVKKKKATNFPITSQWNWEWGNFYSDGFLLKVTVILRTVHLSLRLPEALFKVLPGWQSGKSIQGLPGTFHFRVLRKARNIWERLQNKQNNNSSGIIMS